MQEIVVPNYEGKSLINLVAELEHRLTGASVAPRLADDLSQQIPEAETYVLVLFDGLGTHQLDHGAASDLAISQRATIDAPFP
jgi:hypothetical protein